MAGPLIELQLSAPARVPVGKAVPVAILMRNLTHHAMWMVGVVPGAEGGHRLPRYLPRVVVDGEVVASPAPALGTARVPPLRLDHFHRLQPGEAVDPTESSSRHGWLPLATFLHYRPRRRGTHLFVVTLSTEAEAERWIQQVDLADDRLELIERVRSIPRMLVESNRLEVVAV